MKGGGDDLIGRIDLRPDQGDQEMRGFWLARSCPGPGLEETEAAEAVTAFAFETLEWPELHDQRGHQSRLSPHQGEAGL